MQRCMYTHVFGKSLEQEVIQNYQFITLCKTLSALGSVAFPLLLFTCMLNLVQRSVNSDDSVHPTQRLFVLIKSTQTQGSNTHQANT